MSDNKELNNLLENLFSSVKDAYGIASMIKDIKEKEVFVKQNYEVLRMIDELGHIHFPDADGMPCLENCNIYSVKNLNNNEPFSIGDKTDEGTIKSFYIEDNILWVRTEEKGGVVSINDIQKVKERVPLFTSEDGKEIFEPDETIWVVDKCDYELWSTNAISLACTGENKYFSTEDLAKTFVIMNKPCLSIREIMNNAKYVTNYRIEIDYKALRSIAEEKINNQ